MNKKGLLFDFNGATFFDSERYKEAWDVSSQEYRGYPISDYELDHTYGKTSEKIIKLLPGDMHDEESEKPSKVREALYRECCINDPKMFHLMDDLEDVLGYLKELQIPMAICSAPIRDNIDFFISSFHLNRWPGIDKVIYDNDTHADKISMFHEGIQIIGVKLEDCMIIEDPLSGLDFAYCCQPDRLIATTTSERKATYEKTTGAYAAIHDFRDFDTSFFLK